MFSRCLRRLGILVSVFCRLGVDDEDLDSNSDDESGDDEDEEEGGSSTAEPPRLGSAGSSSSSDESHETEARRDGEAGPSGPSTSGGPQSSANAEGSDSTSSVPDTSGESRREISQCEVETSLQERTSGSDQQLVVQATSSTRDLEAVPAPSPAEHSGDTREKEQSEVGTLFI